MLETRRWSTSAAIQVDAVRYWRQAICEAIFELDFDAPGASALDARLSQFDIGAVQLSEVSISTAHQVIRSREAVARDTRARFNLNYVRRGHWTVEHCGREIGLAAGEFVLLDNRQPYRVLAADGTDHVCVHLPIDWLRCWIPNPDEAVARPIRLGTPWRAALAATLDEAPLAVDQLGGAGDLCAEQIAGALALALGPSRSRNTSHTRLIFLRIQRAMRDRFHDHELDATRMAAILGISPRYLHKILARENTTYGCELIRVRLERAAAMLRDRRFDELSISEIGWRCGFCDPSHFSKRFRLAHDRSPGAYRAEARAAEGPVRLAS